MRRFELVIHRRAGAGSPRAAQALAIGVGLVVALVVAAMLLLGYALLGVLLVVGLAGLAVAIVASIARALWRRATRR